MACGCDDKKITPPSTGCVDSQTSISPCSDCEPCAEVETPASVIQVNVPTVPCNPCAPQPKQFPVCNTGTHNTLCPPVNCCTPVVQSIPGIVVPVTKQTAGITKIFYKYSLKVLNSFNMPAFNGKASLAIGENKGIAVGTILYNDLVGWLRVTSVNKTLNTIEVLNFLATGQIKSPGELIDACTEFALGVPDYSSAGTTPSNQICLLSDFFSPAVDVTGTTNVTIEVSSVNGMQVGSRLSIAGYEYVIKEVVSATVVVIYNAGAGAPAGTKVPGGESCDGECISIITILSADNPCDKTAVQEIVLIGCDGENIVPFTALNDNSIPVWDATSNTWKPEIIANETLECTVLTADLTVDDGGGSFIATVADSSIFTTTGPSSLIVIQGKLFTISTVIDGTHIEVIPAYTVVGIEEFEEGSSVCIAGCCECPYFSDSSFFSAGEETSVAITTVGDKDRLGSDLVITLENPSLCQFAEARIIVTYTHRLDIRNAAAAGTQAWAGTIKTLLDIDGGGFTTYGPNLFEENRFGVKYEFGREITLTHTSTLAPGQSRVFTFRPRITVETATADTANSDWVSTFGTVSAFVVAQGV